MWAYPAVTSQKLSIPSSVAVQSSFPSGRKANAKTSLLCSSDSRLSLRPVKTSHSLTVWSHEEDAKIHNEVEKLNPEIGPSCPDRISNNLPVCNCHRKIENGSKDPAQITSPLESTASESNWQGVGVVKVRKFRYRIKSYARTVPSNEDEKITVKRRRKQNLWNWCYMRWKCYKAKTRECIPQFDFAIISTWVSKSRREKSRKKRSEQTKNKYQVGKQACMQATTGKRKEGKTKNKYLSSRHRSNYSTTTRTRQEREGKRKNRYQASMQAANKK